MMTIYTVYYMKPESFLRFNFGIDFPTVKHLVDTHRPVRSVRAKDPEEVFMQMQGEVWSPNGEKRKLIEALELSHTSMSAGDVVRDHSTGKHFVAAPMGFREIK